MDTCWLCCRHQFCWMWCHRPLTYSKRGNGKDAATWPLLEHSQEEISNQSKDHAPVSRKSGGQIKNNEVYKNSTHVHLTKSSLNESELMTTYFMGLSFSCTGFMLGESSSSDLYNILSVHLEKYIFGSDSRFYFIAAVFLFLQMILWCSPIKHRDISS